MKEPINLLTARVSRTYKQKEHINLYACLNKLISAQVTVGQCQVNRRVILEGHVGHSESAGFKSGRGC